MVPIRIRVPDEYQACLYCDEPVLGDEVRARQVVVLTGGVIVHVECVMRSIVGSVGHQLRRCPCFGGTEEDPPGLSRRQAAREAYRLFTSNQARKN